MFVFITSFHNYYIDLGGEKLVYRVKKPGAHGTYMIVTESLSESKSREDMLSVRCKKKGDRHCS